MEQIHRDKDGNIVSYENWKGEITSQEEMTAYILSIQTEQMLGYRKLYNNTVYKALTEKVAEENSKIDAKTNAYDIFRGQELSMFAHNYGHKNDINHLQDSIDAMNSIMQFALSYDHGFISKAFDGRIAEHLQSKFLGLHSRYGAMGAMTAFFSELDIENRKVLFTYILNKK